MERITTKAQMTEERARPSTPLKAEKNGTKINIVIVNNFDKYGNEKFSKNNKYSRSVMDIDIKKNIVHSE